MYKRKSDSQVFPSEVLDLRMQVFLLSFQKDKYIIYLYPCKNLYLLKKILQVPKLEAELICRIITSLFEDKYQIICQS